VGEEAGERYLGIQQACLDGRKASAERDRRCAHWKGEKLCLNHHGHRMPSLQSSKTSLYSPGFIPGRHKNSICQEKEYSIPKSQCRCSNP
jgi:hypothetical protein